MGRWANKYVIGLTGNIATGKSLVRKMLEHLGALGLDADGLAHQAMSPGAPAYKPVVSAFGRQILSQDGRINRAALAKIVFSSPEALATLERVTHPIIRQAINILVERAQRKVVVIEAIKLLEAGYGEDVDSVWVVDAPPQVVLQRLVTKRKMTEAAARLYMQAQSSQRAKLERADVVIKNGGSLEDVWAQVQTAWNNLPVVAGKPKPPQQVTTVRAEPKKPEPSKPAPAGAKPAAAPARVPAMEITEVHVRRGSPASAGEIAEVLSKLKNQPVSRMDIMMAFGEKAYLLAEANGQIVGIAGMQVENLITRVDEFFIMPGAPVDLIVQGLTKAVEENSKSLESEVAFFFFPIQTTPEEIYRAFVAQDYEAREISDIKVPAWREAAQEVHIDGGAQIYAKKLRAERVLKPL
ncbi:MAG: dephospho-CoA kinase [Anaerolineae bacterium]|nr:dephospho-CoA kinase [Anaerolineae bacterium]